MIFYLFIATLAQGAIFAIVALGLVLTFQVVRFPDLTPDGTFTLGGAVVAKTIYVTSSPILGVLAAILGGSAAGLLTGFLSEKLRINRILSGILVMTMLYTISLRVMGKGNMQLLNKKTIFSPVESIDPRGLLIALLLFIIAALCYLLVWLLLRSEVGLLLRATGQNPSMVQMTAKNANKYMLFGVALSNSVIALGGALACQHYGFADINLGFGTLVSGLACLFLGRSVIQSKSLFGVLSASFTGAFLYIFVRNIALRVGLEATDLKLVTGLIVILILASGRGRRIFSAEDDPF